MNFKILSENMLRFGTKNLSKSNVDILKEQSNKSADLFISNLNFNYEPGDFIVPNNEYNNLVAKLKPLRDAMASGKYANMKHAIEITATATASQLTPDTVAKHFTSDRLLKIGKPIGGEANAQNDNKILAQYRAEYLYRKIIEVMVREKFVVKDNKGNSAVIDQRTAYEMFPKVIKASIGSKKAASAKITSTGQTIKFPPEKEKDDDPKTEILKPMSCKFNKKVEGKQGSAQNNYVGKTIRKVLDFGKESQMELTLDPFTFPDAIYWKCGPKEGFTGFTGKSTATNEMTFRTKYQTGTSYYSDMMRKALLPRSWAGKARKRQFTAELVYFQEYSNLSLTKAIQNVVNEVGGKLQISEADLFPNYAQASEGVKNAIPKFERNIQFNVASWRRSTEGGFGEDVYKKIILPKELDGQEIIIKAFSPLKGTKFRLKAKCS